MRACAFNSVCIRGREMVNRERERDRERERERERERVKQPFVS